jgi:hypothetical protein
MVKSKFEGTSSHDSVSSGKEIETDNGFEDGRFSR